MKPLRAYQNVFSKIEYGLFKSSATSGNVLIGAELKWYGTFKTISD